MLHPNAKQRLKRSIPEQIEVEWRHPHSDTMVAETVDIDRRFKENDSPMNYPVVAMELSPEAVPRYAFGDKESDHEIKRKRPDDPTIAHELYIGTPMYAELHITVAVRSSLPNIPKHVVADAIAEEVYYQFQHNSEHLNEQGTTADGEPVDYEWPMVVSQPVGDGTTNMNRMVDEQAVQRRALLFRVDYYYWRYEEVPAMESFEYQFGVDKDYDGEAEDLSDPELVPVSPFDDSGGD